MIEYEDNKEIIDKLCLRLQKKIKARGINVDLSILDLNDEIITAIEAVNERRNYIIKDNKIYDDKYTSLIIKLCLYSISKMGAEGESTHMENTIQRVYENGNDYPESLLSEVKPLARGV